jgi:hypothetical protein
VGAASDPAHANAPARAARAKSRRFIPILLCWVTVDATPLFLSAGRATPASTSPVRCERAPTTARLRSPRRRATSLPPSSNQWRRPKDPPQNGAAMTTRRTFVISTCCGASILALTVLAMAGTVCASVKAIPRRCRSEPRDSAKQALGARRLAAAVVGVAGHVGGARLDAPSPDLEGDGASVQESRGPVDPISGRHAVHRPQLSVTVRSICESISTSCQNRRNRRKSVS